MAQGTPRGTSPGAGGRSDDVTGARGDTFPGGPRERGDTPRDVTGGVWRPPGDIPHPSPTPKRDPGGAGRGRGRTHLRARRNRRRPRHPEAPPPPLPVAPFPPLRLRLSFSHASLPEGRPREEVSRDHREGRGRGPPAAPPPRTIETGAGEATPLAGTRRGGRGVAAGPRSPMDPYRDPRRVGIPRRPP